ncbi:hypothetical protein EYF80_035872 [Liparis tanakae]|uniref:Uncharacterized protein n=1 Tax=Liparis tanakae TaxID=230148 RepID=A0A4Z2GKW4_9TELE|nr:hypothetical protein EYF80_035872 [Liparis tanakae]
MKCPPLGDGEEANQILTPCPCFLNPAPGLDLASFPLAPPPSLCLLPHWPGLFRDASCLAQGRGVAVTGKTRPRSRSLNTATTAETARSFTLRPPSDERPVSDQPGRRPPSYSNRSSGGIHSCIVTNGIIPVSVRSWSPGPAGGLRRRRWEDKTTGEETRRRDREREKELKGGGGGMGGRQNLKERNGMRSQTEDRRRVMFDTVDEVLPPVTHAPAEQRAEKKMRPMFSVCQSRLQSRNPANKPRAISSRHPVNSGELSSVSDGLKDRSEEDRWGKVFITVQPTRAAGSEGVGLSSERSFSAPSSSAFSSSCTISTESSTGACSASCFNPSSSSSSLSSCSSASVWTTYSLHFVALGSV